MSAPKYILKTDPSLPVYIPLRGWFRVLIYKLFKKRFDIDMTYGVNPNSMMIYCNPKALEVVKTHLMLQGIWFEVDVAKPAEVRSIDTRK